MGITKSQLAQELGTTRSAVSKYVARGLPVNCDGTLDREAALEWIERNVAPTQHRGKGAAVARERLERPMPECLRYWFDGQITKDGDPVREMLAATLVGATQDIPWRVATLAVQAGLSMERAFLMFHVAGYVLAAYSDELMERCRVEWRHADHFIPPTPPNWAALAERAGEEVDEVAWEEYAKTAFRERSEQSSENKKPRRSRKNGAV